MESLKKQALQLYNGWYMPLLLLVCLFMLLSMLMPNWFYNSIGWIDGWLYTGYFMDYSAMKTAFPQRSMGDLLPLLLPGKIFYSLFSPLAANILFKLVKFVLTGCLVFSFLKTESSRRSAYAGTIVLMLSYQAIEALRSDYTDGMVLLYISASMFCLSKAFQAVKAKYIWVFAAGACFSASVFTAFLSAATGAAIAVYIGFKEWRSEGGNFKRTAQTAACFAAGFAFTAFLFALINRLMGFGWYFFKNTVERSFQFLNELRARKTFFQAVADDNTRWIVFPLLFTFSTFIVFLKKKLLTKTALCAFSMFAMLFAIYAGLQIFKNQETISNLYYINHLLFFMIYAVTALIFEPFVIKLSRRSYLLFLTALFYAMLTPYIIGITYLPYAAPLKVLALFSLPAALIFAEAFKQRGFITLTLFLLMAFFINYSPSYTRYIQNLVHNYRGANIIMHDHQTALGKWTGYIKQKDPGREYYLWFNIWSNWYFRGLASATHSWELRLLNEEMPHLNGIVAGGSATPLPNINKLLLMASEDFQIEQAQAALNNYPGYKAQCSAAEEIFNVNNLRMLVSDCVITPVSQAKQLGIIIEASGS